MPPRMVPAHHLAAQHPRIADPLHQETQSAFSVVENPSFASHFTRRRHLTAPRRPEHRPPTRNNFSLSWRIVPQNPPQQDHRVKRRAAPQLESADRGLCPCSRPKAPIPRLPLVSHRQAKKQTALRAPMPAQPRVCGHLNDIACTRVAALNHMRLQKPFILMEALQPVHTVMVPPSAPP